MSNILSDSEWYARTHPRLSHLITAEEESGDDIAELISGALLTLAATPDYTPSRGFTADAFVSTAPTEQMNDIAADEHVVAIAVADSFANNGTDDGTLSFYNAAENDAGFHFGVTFHDTKVVDDDGNVVDFSANQFAATAEAGMYTIDRNTNVVRQYQKGLSTAQLNSITQALGSITYSTLGSDISLFLKPDATDQIVFKGLAIVKWRGDNGPDSFTHQDRLDWINTVNTNFRAGQFWLPEDLRG